MTDARPDPDALLEQIREQEAGHRRGRLKIFFGASAGVGKTCAMLSAAQAAQKNGVNVLIGVVETHGRTDTAALLDGLRQLPRQTVAYKGHSLAVFDLDAALAAKPDLILMDEYAHTNLPGARHPKRWQDVEELLDAGIDVCTTLNVQHLESLNDVVGQITGIVVRETLPDKVFDSADEVALIDLPPDELLARLKAGKVYFEQQASRAVHNFFRKGNLLALRELALRRTADRVDAQMRAYRADQDIRPVWQARERLLVCLGPGPGGEKLIRTAKRLASSLDADLLAIHIEKPSSLRRAAREQPRILKLLRLAQELGAETSTLAATDLPEAVIEHAKRHNVSKLVLGKSPRGRWQQMLRPALVDVLSRQTDSLDVFVVGIDPAETLSAGPFPAGKMPARNSEHQPSAWLSTVAICALTTIFVSFLVPFLELSNVIMLYLMAVVGIAIRFGRGPSVLASILAVASFDFFFVPPRWSFSVSDTQFILTFLVMLIVSLTISQLTAQMSFNARLANQRERRTRALYDLGKELAAALTASQIVEISGKHVEALFAAHCELLVPDSHEQLRSASHPVQTDLALAQWVYAQEKPAGPGTDTLPSTAALYVPLKAPMRTRGVLALFMAQTGTALLPEQQRLLETCAAQIALALERVHYVEVAQDAVVVMESERLRNSVLSAISHDLRTPLTTLVGLSSLLASPLDGERQQTVARQLHDEALRMNNMVTNLLDMARLQSGVRLNHQWQMLDDVVGCAIRETARSLVDHQLDVNLPADLPLLAFDEVLIERVLVNLLQNAAKYTPPGSKVALSARVEGDRMLVMVSDNGPGLPAGLDARVFDKFTRGEQESTTSGVGLGLAICRTIVEAHGGSIRAERLTPNGVRFVFTLPLGTPPIVPEA